MLAAKYYIGTSELP